eukprot:3327758-Rhodomonas_salina.3
MRGQNSPGFEQRFEDRRLVSSKDKRALPSRCLAAKQTMSGPLAAKCSLRNEVGVCVGAAQRDDGGREGGDVDGSEAGDAAARYGARLLREEELQHARSRRLVPGVSSLARDVKRSICLLERRHAFFRLVLWPGASLEPPCLRSAPGSTIVDASSTVKSKGKSVGSRPRIVCAVA